MVISVPAGRGLARHGTPWAQRKEHSGQIGSSMANVTTARMRVTLDTSMMVKATAGYFDLEEVLGGPDVTRMKMPGTLDGKYLEKYMAAGLGTPRVHVNTRGFGANAGGLGSQP